MLYLFIQVRLTELTNSSVMTCFAGIEKKPPTIPGCSWISVHTSKMLRSFLKLDVSSYLIVQVGGDEEPRSQRKLPVKLGNGKKKNKHDEDF